MKSTPKSIQKILSSYFSLMMLSLLVLITIVFSLIQYMHVRANTDEELQRLCDSIADNIDLQIGQMDNICLNTIHSVQIKDTFYSYINDTTATRYKKSQWKRTLSNALSATRGVDTSIRQINLYDMKKGGFGTGNYTGDLQENAPDLVWYNPTVNSHGQKYIPAAAQNPLISAGAGTDEDRFYLSLYRMYYDKYHVPMGFVEVMKYYDVLFDKAQNPESRYAIDVVIYSEDGSVLFPLNTDEKDFSYFPYKAQKKNTVYNTDKNCREHLYFSNVEYSNFTVATAIKSTRFFFPIMQSIFYIGLVFFGVFILFLGFATAISNRISAPIKKIYHFFYNIDPQNQFRQIKMKDTGIIELDKLKHALNEAMDAQKNATDSMMMLKEQELQAQMLALQAQMNPHFLYNSLSTVAAMAQEGMTRPIVQMCEDITSILRYISSNKEPTSSVEEELEHCDLYLKCMKLRFGENLQYDFQVNDELLEIPIPKLCIQLLVENAVKSTTRQSPPWKITIFGHIDNVCWYLGVKDNGPGFEEERLQSLRTQMNEILKNGLLPNLEINGMGVLNIFIRFYLIYGHSFIFDLGNLPEGGAVVIVGGKFHDETNPL